MRETKFIEQNQEKWREYEQMLDAGWRDPEKLNDLFIQITDDLSYARTFYPNRSVKVYLNHLAQRIFHHVYKAKNIKSSRFITFWTDDVPQVMWESRYAMRLSLVLFVLAFTIGVVSSIINPDFARIILGDSYVDMTLANIDKGDPMAVYKDSGPFGMTLGIAANNLYVAFKTALFGVLASIGTAFMMIFNGVMVGSFQYFFIEKGLFWESFLTIWIHGTLEISAIIIAGGAGLTIGSGLLFPGTYTRTQAFQVSMRRGLKVFFGVVPVIILAAIFEGFLTRFTNTPDIIRGLFILASLAFVLGYFVWLPRVKARRGDFLDAQKDADLPPDRVRTISFDTIKSAGEIISDTFTILFQKNLQLTLAVLTASALFYTIISLGWISNPTGKKDTFDIFYDYFGESWASPLRWFVTTIFMALVLTSTWLSERLMPRQLRPGNIWLKYGVLPLLVIPVALSIWIFQHKFKASDNIQAQLLLSFSITGFVSLMSMVVMAPVLWLAHIRYANNGFLGGIPDTIKGIFSWTPIVTGFMFLGMLFLTILFFTSDIWQIFIGAFSWLVPPGEANVAKFTEIVNTFVISFLIHMIWMLLVLSGILYYFSNLERLEAKSLLERIEQVGTTRQIRGIIRE